MTTLEKLHNAMAGKRMTPPPEEWVLSICGKDALDITHVAHFGTGEQAEEYACEVARICRGHAALKAQTKELKAVLSDYGQHLPGCNAIHNSDRDCTCGWDGERKALKEEL